MDRKEFLSQLGIGSAAALAITCLQACSKNETGGSSVDFTIDLNNSQFSALKNPGGFVVTQGIIVALATSGSYLAVSSRCPHEGVTVEYSGSKNQFICNAHNSIFASTGSRISGPANTGLKQYQTSLNGTTLRIYS
ncbi:MAG: ubiquinol-cytochrome c reductase iron-sulfur subunit [Bacteroidota bacterium]|jgi:cytochrome b6-f complex iron-sulfur subunit